MLERLGERPTVPGYRRESQSPPGPAGRADRQAGTARLFARRPGFRSVQRMQRPPGPGDAKGSESPTERFLGIPATLPAPPSERKNPKPSKQVARVPGTHSTRRFDRESGFCVSPLLPGRRAVILRAQFTARRETRTGYHAESQCSASRTFLQGSPRPKSGPWPLRYGVSIDQAVGLAEVEGSIRDRLHPDDSGLEHSIGGCFARTRLECQSVYSVDCLHQSHATRTS